MKLKRLNKTSLAAIIVFCVLAASFAVFLPIYLKYNESNRALYEDQKIRFVAYGEELGSFTIGELAALADVQEKDFVNIYDTSNSDPVEKTYTGLELKAVLHALGVDLNNARTVILQASDGAEKVYSPEDVRRDDNVFIAYKVNGKPFTKGIDGLGHTRETEDGGPFVVIKVSDVFSSSRCKLLTGVVVA
jgi:hypothetical protein